MSLQDMTGVTTLFEPLKREFFDLLVLSTKIINGYNPDSKTFTASTLAQHMRTTLKQVCNIAMSMIIKKSKSLPVDDPEASLKSIKCLKCLVENHWTSEISSLALKNLNEQQWEKPNPLPLSEDVMNFQKYSTKEVKQASQNINKGINVRTKYRQLSENSKLLHRSDTASMKDKKINIKDETDSDKEQEVETELFHTLNLQKPKPKSKGSVQQVPLHLHFLISAESRWPPTTSSSNKDEKATVSLKKIEMDKRRCTLRQKSRIGATSIVTSAKPRSPPPATTFDEDKEAIKILQKKT
ncbi:hypothetical protein FQA39_LY17360 [Lamprigera yunnana]|nr:hypothetical protein FQA39_LY17360 [Lamprigera yunnana]